MKLDLFVAIGGRSTEHEVSIKSGFNIISGADRQKYNVYALYAAKDGNYSVFTVPEGIALQELFELCEGSEKSSIQSVLLNYFSDSKNKVVFPIIHGNFGEDGTIQGLLECLDIPYVGCGVAASGVGMEKAVMKLAAETLGIPMAEYVCIDRVPYLKDSKKVLEDTVNQLGLPVFVKPSNGGSSVGISSAHTIEELKNAVEDAFRYDRKILAEKLVKGREIEIGVLGNYDAECESGEFLRNPSFFDYHAKYLDDGLQMRIPAEIPVEDYEKMKEYALAIFRGIGALGLSRVDFFYTDKGEILFNEINTLPGFTSVSMYPSLWRVTKGMDTGKLVDKLIELAFEAHEEKLRTRGAIVNDN